MSQQERATILLIDDHPMLRTGVKQLISMAPDIQVIGEASNGAQGIELADQVRTARFDLIRLRISVSRGPMLEDVADENLFPRHVDRRQNLG